MATPQQLREETALVAAAAVTEMQGLVASATAAAVREMLLDALPGLILSFSESAAVVATEWYDEFRAELDLPVSYKSFIPDIRDPNVVALINWAEKEAQDELARMTLIEGGVSKRVSNGSRQAIIENAGKDPKARGFQRYARQTNDGCGFCRMLAGRGLVYRSEQTASFGAHDHCHCVAVPAFNGVAVPVRPYEPSSKNISDAERARVRAYLRDH